MDIRACIDFVKRHEKELAVFNPGDGGFIVEEIASHFETRNVRVTSYRTASGSPKRLAVLSDESSVLAVLGVSDLWQRLGDTQSGSRHAESETSPQGSVLGHLKETTFTSYDNDQLLYASREIEDRARRVGDGSLHAGFQRVSVLEDETAVYTDLAHKGIEIHTYGIPDTTPPNIGSGDVHAIPSNEIATSWFVVYDGGGDDTQKSALLAEERGENSFYGAWTYDPRIVDAVLKHLEGTYLSDTGSHRRLQE